MRLGVGVRFPIGSIWATMQIADNSSLVSQRTSEIGGQGYDSDRRAELFPEIVDPSLDDDGEPSCSAAAALERQEPFINSTLAQHALALLARLFRYGTLCYHGGFINLSTGIGSRLPIDASLWRRLRRRCKSEKSRA